MNSFECEFLLLDSQVKGAIKECEGKHIQQIAYSSYHDALTQICFGCKKIRTNLKEQDAFRELDEVKDGE